MRMMKRVAVGILVAMMALSMMTACGGGNSTGGSGNGDSQKPNNSGVSDTDKTGDGDTKNPGNDNGNPSAGDNNNTSASSRYANTRTAKYFAARHVTQENVYVEADVQRPGVGGSFIYARKGKTTRYNRNFTFNSSARLMGMTDNALIVDDIIYELYPERKQYINFAEYWSATEEQVKQEADSIRCAEGVFIVPADDGSLISVKTGEYEVNQKTYYADEILMKNGSSRNCFIYCFEKNDVNATELKYVVQTQPVECGGDNIAMIKTVRPNPDQSLFEIPADYEYTHR